MRCGFLVAVLFSSITILARGSARATDHTDGTFDNLDSEAMLGGSAITGSTIAVSNRSLSILIVEI